MESVTLMGLFWQADIVVKAVMLLLIAASVWSWAIMFEKARLLRRLRRAADRFEDEFWGGRSLDSLYEQIVDRSKDPMAHVFAAGMKEWRNSQARGIVPKQGVRAGLQQRIERVMDITIGREMTQAEKRMTFLASTGAVAPFVGLFGTVWGIMNAFAAIAQTQNTSLAVVAPGIAEALFATALGLLAAIPAVVAYNKFSSDLGRYGERLDGFAGELSSILSRHMDEKSEGVA